MNVRWAIAGTLLLWSNAGLSQEKMAPSEQPFEGVIMADPNHPLLEINAVAWSKQLQQLVRERKWAEARAIAPLGTTVFAHTQVWQVPSFLATWQTFLRGNAYSSWTVGQEQKSLWRLADGHKATTPSVGVRQEANGSWWLVFARPDKVDHQDIEGWNCQPTCSVTIEMNGRPLTFSMRAPNDNHYKQTHILGMPLSPSMLQDRQQTWVVHFPDNSVETFDMSFVPMVCGYKLGQCFSPPPVSAPAVPVPVPAAPVSGTVNTGG